MAGITAAQINKLTEGERIACGRSIYVRRNRDGTATGTLRVKQAGRLRDLNIAAMTLPATRASIDALFAEAEALRGRAKSAKAIPAAVAGTTRLASGATMADVWRGFAAAVTASEKWTPLTLRKNIERVTRHLEPWRHWHQPIHTVTAADAAALLARMNADTPDQARKIGGILSQVFTHAISNGLITASPMNDAKAIVRNTTRRVTAKHFPHITDIKELRRLYAAIQNMSGAAAIRNAMRLQALTAARTGEVIGARWDEFDFAARAWRIPRHRMKTKDAQRGAHVRILAPESIQWLATLPRDDSGFLFAGRKGYGDHINESTISLTMRRQLGMANKFVPHSWRASLRTLAIRAVDTDGRPLFAAAWIETLLDHVPEDEVVAAYDRGNHTEGAARVLAWWRDVLEGVNDGQN